MKRCKIGMMILLLLFLGITAVVISSPVKAASTPNFGIFVESSLTAAGENTISMTSKEMVLNVKDCNDEFSVDNATWSIASGASCLSVDSSAGGILGLCTINALKPGKAVLAVQVTYTDGSGGTKKTTIMCNVKVNCEIKEESDGNFSKVLPDDTEKSLIIKPGVSEYSLNLSYGQSTDSNCSWTSDNKDVVTVDKGKVTVVGAGKAVIRAMYQSDDSIEELADEVKVYVLPTVTSSLGAQSPINVHSNKETESLSINTVSAIGGDAIGDKFEWVITTDFNGNSQTIADSLDMTSDVIHIEADSLNQKLKVVGKAGTYNICFFPKGVYSSYKEEGISLEDIPSYVYQKTTVKIFADVKNKEVYLVKGDSVNLASAFNMTKALFNLCFDTAITDGADVVKYNTNMLTGTTVNQGKAKVSIAIKNPTLLESYMDCELTSDGYYTCGIYVTNRFSLDRHEITLAKGASYNLGSNSDGEGLKYSSSDSNYVKIDNNGLITAVEKTETNNDIVITAVKETEDGVVHQDTCTVHVVDAITNIGLSSEKNTIGIGENMVVLSDVPSGVNASIFKWMISDESVASLDPSADGRSAIVKGKKSGTVTVTCLNMDNKLYDTYTIQVRRQIESLSLEKSNISLQLDEKYYLLQPIYELSDEGEVNFIFTSSDENIASVASTGLITLKKAGVVSISVAPAYNPTGVYAVCTIQITEPPVITPEPTIAPTETPTVEPTIAPTETPTVEPTIAPTEAPTVEPTVTPTIAPTVEPTIAPTIAPTVEPTITPTIAPTVQPTTTPVAAVSTMPATAKPTVSPVSEAKVKIATLKGLTKSLKASKTSIKMSWKKIKGADGYYVYGAKCSKDEKNSKMKKLKTILSGNTVTFSHKGLKKKTWYKYIVYAYRLVDGKKVVFAQSLDLHGMTTGSIKYTNPTGIKGVKNKVTISAGKTKKINAKVVLPKKKMTKFHVAKLRYLSSNKKIVSVNKKGKITAKTKGNCIIYVVTQNGVSKKIRVDVK